VGQSGAVPFRHECRDVINTHAEDVNVLVTHTFMHFNVGAVQGANRQRAVDLQPKPSVNQCIGITLRQGRERRQAVP
jgi:hypothetical protein